MVAQEERKHQRMTVEEWRALLRTSDVKYEYSNGWVYAMAGGSADHSAIAINVIRDMQDALGERPCRVYNSDMAVRLSPSEYRFPDVTVTCDERDRGRVTEVQTPRVIVEVLSDSTEKDDRIGKFALYGTCASVREYVLIATRYQAVEVYRRGQPRWTYQGYGPGDSVELESIDVRLPVAGLYRLTDVPLPSERATPA
ncbi:MAG TPA: Uma2 family endonuclease [Chloroflexota bacterium]|nr:Uma2 family endonuclease [Chloroflexota bacterium]